MRRILTAVAWPYANGPRHVGHIAGFGVPADVFARYQRMRGHDVLMVSGTDEHGTPIQVQADREGVTARALADRYNLVIAEDLQRLGLSYDLFTRTTTRNHYRVVQQLFLALHANGYVAEHSQLSAIDPVSRRGLPDRYVEGTCPHCDSPDARGDQCDNCGRQLDPADLANPRSKTSGLAPEFVESLQLYLDLPAFTAHLRTWLEDKSHWRPNVRKFSANLVDELQQRAISRDLDWGVPIPLPQWQAEENKRLYVWFDAVIGYLSASIEWSRRTGIPWERFWNDPEAEAYYFMGKDNVVFHTVVWPAMLLGASDAGPSAARPYGPLNLPTEVVASEFLTMEGRKFSSSRAVVIYVRDVLDRYGPDALRYYLCVAGPETSDTDFTWEQFVVRNNTELVASWGNLVNRVMNLAHASFGYIPKAGQLHPADQAVLAKSRAAFDSVGALLDRNQVKAAIHEAMQTVRNANLYVSTQAPWKLAADRDRQATVIYVALQLISDAKTLLTPFIPHSSQRVYEMLGYSGVWSGQPDLAQVDDLDGGPAYPILRGDYANAQAQWSSIPVEPGTPLGKPSPLFVKLDGSVIEEELARHASDSGATGAEHPS